MISSLIKIAALVFGLLFITTYLKGNEMKDFTEQNNPLVQIDLTTAVANETPDLESNGRSFPALNKYTVDNLIELNGVIVLIAWGPLDVNKVVGGEDGTLVFRSVDGGLSFTRTVVGVGTRSALLSANQVLYLQIVDAPEDGPENIKNYLSTDLGQTWVENSWMPTTVLSNGWLFIEEYEQLPKISTDSGKTWKTVENQPFIAFYKQAVGIPLNAMNSDTRFAQLNERTLVTRAKDGDVLFFDLKSQRIEKKKFVTPENKRIVRYEVIQNELVFKLFPHQENGKYYGQFTFFFPETNEYVVPPKLPEPIDLKIRDNYIGGWTRIDRKLTHVYTLDRGKHWNYETIKDYFTFFYSHPSEWVFFNGDYWMLRTRKDNMGEYLLKVKLQGESLPNPAPKPAPQIPAPVPTAPTPWQDNGKVTSSPIEPVAQAENPYQGQIFVSGDICPCNGVWHVVDDEKHALLFDSSQRASMYKGQPFPQRMLRHVKPREVQVQGGWFRKKTVQVFEYEDKVHWILSSEEIENYRG